MRSITKFSGIILLLIFFTGLTANAQKTIRVKDLTTKKLAELCKENDVEVLDIQDSYLKVKDIFTIYLDIDPTKRFVSFSSTYPLVSGVRPEIAMELMNKLNSEIILIKSFYNPKNNSINYMTHFWVQEGFVDQTMVKALKMYVTAIRLSLEKDTEKLIK